jgi:hypothetical protein
MRGCDKAGAGGHPPGRLGVGLSLLSEQGMDPPDKRPD